MPGLSTNCLVQTIILSLNKIKNMKKIAVLAIALSTLSISSCKKAYKCECTTSDAYGTRVITRDISKTGEKNAHAICGNYIDTYTGVVPGSSTASYVETINTSCSLK